MKVNSEQLRKDMMQVILDSIYNMEEVDVTTDKIFDQIRPLIQAVENLGSESEIEKTNELIFNNKFKKFEESLKEEYKNMDTYDFEDWRRSPDMPNAEKGLKYLMNEYKVNRDEAIFIYFQDKTNHATGIIKNHGFINQKRHENYSDR